MPILIHVNIHTLLNHTDAYPWKQTKGKSLRPKCNFNFFFFTWIAASRKRTSFHLSNTKLLKASARSRIVQQNLGVCWPTFPTRGCQWQSLLFHLHLALLLLRCGVMVSKHQNRIKHELNAKSYSSRGDSDRYQCGTNVKPSHKNISNSQADNNSVHIFVWS